MHHKTEIRRREPGPEVGRTPEVPDACPKDEAPELEDLEDAVTVTDPRAPDPEIREGFVPDLDDEDEPFVPVPGEQQPLPSLH